MISTNDEPTGRFLSRLLELFGRHRSEPADVCIHPAGLLPDDHRLVTYEGSLTTPPSTEGVLWNMLIDPIEVSQAQQSAFESLIGQNARPIQARNDRLLRFGY